jgi:hypothetical protein
MGHTVKLWVRLLNVNSEFQTPEEQLRCENFAEEFFVLLIWRNRIAD